MLKQKSIWQIIKPVRAKITISFIFASLASSCSIAAIICLAFLVIKIQKEAFPWLLLSLVCAFFILAFICRNLAFTLSHLAAFKLEYLLRIGLCQKFNKISLGQAQQLGTGAMSNVLDNDVNNLHGFVADSAPLLPSVFITLIIIPPILFYFDSRLALLNIVLLVLIIIMAAVIRKKENQIMQKSALSNAEIQGAIVEYIQAMPVVRTFDSASNSFSRYQQALDQYTEVMTHSLKATQSYANSIRFLFNPLLTLVFLLWFGGYLYFANMISTYSWVAILLLSSSLSEIIMPWYIMQGAISHANLSAQRIFQMQALPELAQVAAEEQCLPKDSSIEFKNVDFYYNQPENKAIENVSFTIAAGSRCALVGLSGAGKTTVARLIARFWDVSAGTVLIGGVDIRHIATEELVKHIAFVFQDNFLFSMSIADNIRIAKPDASDEEVERAAKLAQAHDFIMALPNGYASNAGERGLFLSGGQKQRITIARAILQDKPILILDEATAFSDPENESKIMQALDVLMKDRTVVVIAHRFATIKACEQILVFDGGQLLESGHHQDLLSKNGLYAKLWQHHEYADNWHINNSQVSEGV